MTATAKTRVFLVDDHPLMREGLALQIDAAPDLEVCGMASSVAETLKLLPDSQPDVAILDISLPDGHGIDLIKEVRERLPQVKILVISQYDEALYLDRCLRNGALGYFNKRDTAQHLLQAVRTVRTGKRYLSGEAAQRLLDQMLEGNDPTHVDPVSKLTDRELEVFRLIGQGKTTGAIAEQLFVSPHTIDSHREKIRRKLGLKTGHELLQRAMQWILENGE